MREKILGIKLAVLWHCGRQDGRESGGGKPGLAWRHFFLDAAGRLGDVAMDKPLRNA